MPGDDIGCRKDPVVVTPPFRCDVASEIVHSGIISTTRTTRISVGWLYNNRWRKKRRGDWNKGLEHFVVRRYSTTSESGLALHPQLVRDSSILLPSAIMIHPHPHPWGPLDSNRHCDFRATEAYVRHACCTPSLPASVYCQHIIWKPPLPPWTAILLHAAYHRDRVNNSCVPA